MREIFFAVRSAPQFVCHSKMWNVRMRNNCGRSEFVPPSRCTILRERFGAPRARMTRITPGHMRRGRKAVGQGGGDQSSGRSANVAVYMRAGVISERLLLGTRSRDVGGP